MLEVCADVNAALSEVPQVTMAAVGGACLAGGVQLAASCDLVLAHEGASFCLPGVRSPGGFCHTPAVAAGARLAPHKALELALLGSEICAAEAARIGLVNSVVVASEWPTAVDRSADQLARTFSKSVADGKRTFYRQLAEKSLRDRYALATDAMAASLAGLPGEHAGIPGARREEVTDTAAARIHFAYTYVWRCRAPRPARAPRGYCVVSCVNLMKFLSPTTGERRPLRLESTCVRHWHCLPIHRCQLYEVCVWSVSLCVVACVGRGSISVCVCVCVVVRRRPYEVCGRVWARGERLCT